MGVRTWADQRTLEQEFIERTRREWIEQAKVEFKSASQAAAALALLKALLGPGQVQTGLSIHRARVLCRIANHPADYAEDIRGYRAKAMKGRGA